MGWERSLVLRYLNEKLTYMKRLSTLIMWMVLFSLPSFAQSDCKIENLVIEKLPCNAQQKFAVVINFNPVNPPSPKFKVQGNGINHGTFSYTDLPITIDGLPGNCTTPYEFVIRDLELPACSAVFELGKVCCTQNCGISIINLKQKECLEGEAYKINFDVIPPANGPLGFDVFLNGVHHSFHKYIDTPVENLIIPNHGQDQDTLVVCNNDDQGCCDTLILNNKCSCFITNAAAQLIECSDINDTYFARINFEHGTSNDSFLIGGSANLYGTFAYSDLPVVIGPLSFSNTNTDLLIADESDVFCFGELVIPPVQECQSCKIYDAAYEILPCVKEGKIYIKFKFKSNNTGVNGFSVRGNGTSYGTFAYGEEFYYLGPITPDCNKKYEFIIVDNASNTCSTVFANNVKLCCQPCEIGTLTITENCDATPGGIKIQFDSGGVPDDSVAVYVNGVLVGKYKKTAEPLAIIYPFVNGKSYAVKVIAIKTDGCFRQAEFTYECNNSEPCAFSEPQLEFSECTGDNTFKVFLKFTPTGPHADQFYVSINDKVYGPLLYGQPSYTLGPNAMACNGVRIVLKDAFNENCRLVIEKEIQKCCEEECEIAPGSPEAICFEGKIIGLQMVVKGKSGNKYNAYADGVLLGSFNYSTTPVLFNLTPRNDGKITLKFIDVNDNTCFLVKEYFINCENCGINNLSAKPVDCSETSFKFEIDFDVVNPISDSFYVFVNNVRLGRYAANQLPVVSPAYDPRADVVYVIKVFDASNEACRSIIEIPFIECEQTATDNIVKSFNLYSTGGNLYLSNEGLPINSTAVIYGVDGRLIQPAQNLVQGENKLYEVTSSSMLIVSIMTDTGISTRLIFCGR